NPDVKAEPSHLRQNTHLDEMLVPKPRVETYEVGEQGYIIWLMTAQSFLDSGMLHVYQLNSRRRISLGHKNQIPSVIRQLLRHSSQPFENSVHIVPFAEIDHLLCSKQFHADTL